jgi:hypothetical protein
MKGPRDGIHEILELHFARIVDDFENDMRRTEDGLAKHRSDFYQPQTSPLEGKMHDCEEEYARMEASQPSNLRTRRQPSPPGQNVREVASTRP